MTGRSFSLALPAALLCSPLLSSAAAPELTPDQFIISFWHGPGPKDTTPEYFQRIAQAGFNLVTPHCAEFTPEQALSLNRKILELCAQHGLQAIVHDPRLYAAQPNSPDFEKTISAVVADYSSYPALYGYNLADEPTNPAFPRLAAITAALRAQDPKRLAYINLLPIHATGPLSGTNFTNDDAQFPEIKKVYDQHLEQFISVVKPRLLSYDEYDLVDKGGPFQLDSNGMLGMYFPNLEMVREKSLQHKLPFNNIILVTPHQHAYGHYRDPTLEELRFLVYTTLAYGARGLMYFTYNSVSELGVGIIAPDGQPTRHYAEVTQLNKEIRALAPVLIKLHSDGVYHVGHLPKLTRPLPDGGLVQRVEGGDAVLGLFSDPKGPRYLMVVNKDYRQPHEITVTLAEPLAVERISQHDGHPRPLAAEGNAKEPLARWKLSLAAGEGALLKFSPPKPAS